MNWFQPQSTFFQGIGKIFEIVIVCLLWFLTSLPIVTIGASTTALYYVCTKVICHNRGYLIKEYFFCLKKSIRQTIIPWLVQCIVAFILCFNIRLCQLTQDSYLKYLEIPMWVLLTLLICFSVYYYALVAHFDNTTVQLIKYSVVIAILNLPSTILNIVIFLLIGILLYLLPQLSILAPGVMGMVLSMRLEPLFLNYE